MMGASREASTANRYERTHGWIHYGTTHGQISGAFRLGFVGRPPSHPSVTTHYPYGAAGMGCAVRIATPVGMREPAISKPEIATSMRSYRRSRLCCGTINTRARMPRVTTIANARLAESIGGHLRRPSRAAHPAGLLIYLQNDGIEWNALSPRVQRLEDKPLTLNIHRILQNAVFLAVRPRCVGASHHHVFPGHWRRRFCSFWESARPLSRVRPHTANPRAGEALRHQRIRGPTIAARRNVRPVEHRRAHGR